MNAVLSGVVAAILLGAGAAVVLSRRSDATTTDPSADPLFFSAFDPSQSWWEPDPFLGGGFGEMRLSTTGLSFIKSWEGLRVTAYRDAGGVLTIGYGHTGPDVFAGLTISPTRAEELLRDDVAGAEAVVNRFVDVPLSQGQFDALVSFVYNLGSGNFERSTLLAKLNAGDYAGAAREFDEWVYAGNTRLQGLVNRRNAEQQLFLS